jgi:predicted anti-sigma-YlaC factor YlaD
MIDFLVAYLEKSIDETSRSRFDEHLDACPYCRDYLTSYEETIRLARSSMCEASEEGSAPLPEQLVQAILKARDPDGER